MPMKQNRYTPRYDKLFFIILIPTALFLLAMLVTTILSRATGGWIVVLGANLFTAYFIISPCFGYVELRETELFIKFGFFMKRQIPYGRIRGIEKKRGAIADSMLSLKNALDHINIKYNSFDVASVSVKREDMLIEEIKARCGME